MESRPVLQKSAEPYEPRGRLDPEGFDRHVDFRIWPPTEALAPFLEHFWVIRWDRAHQPTYVSRQVMHRPYVDVYIGPREWGIQCTFRGTRAYEAAEVGRIVGARFRPGAFHAFWEGSLSGLADQTIALPRVFPLADAGFIREVQDSDDETAVGRLSELILSRRPQPDPQIDLIGDIIAAVETDRRFTTVTAVAQTFLRSERWVQQLFSTYLGVGLKWLLLRARLLEAAQIIRATPDPDWAALAYDLGYSSQQHFISDFKQVVGLTPLQYKRGL